ncbi:unnamed protein product [Closterium sp. NIES-64]|nr:unnamed protein product [Closterium sp. NIES-64]
MIQPYNERKEAAEKFLQQELQRQGKAPGLVRLDFAPIQDPVPERGGSDPSLDCIVVSEETVGGAAAINRMRAANQITPLHQAEEAEAAAQGAAAGGAVPEGTREAAREGWHSEEREAGQGRHSEEGGAGQGRQWRVGAVDCDRLAHRAYEPGTPAYRRIVELFGASVVRAADGQIDRAALGAQVFSCPEKMAALTGVVWPMVRQIVEEEREAAGAGGWEVTFESPKKATNCEKAPTSSEFTGGASTFSECTEKASASETCRNSFTIRPIAPPAAVLIVEAAMMVEAGSDQTVDEVWVVFVPEAEAKARLMARNGVTEEEAGKRIAAQMTSSARLAHADVAIYNGASEDVTRHQLERAWSEVATQRAGPCLEQWNENFNRLQEQWSISSGNPHSMAAHMQPHFLEAARSVWTRWAALMWRLDVDADVAERWFLKLVLVEEGVRGEKEGEKAGEEGGQQVGVAGGWVAAVIVCFQHLRSQIHRVDRPNALKLALFFALHAASLSAPTSPPLPPSTTQPPTTDDPPPAFPSFTPELFNAAGVLAAAREALQRFAVDADHSQECLVSGAGGV